MEEIMWHRRESRRQTEKTNFFLSSGSLLSTRKVCLNDRALRLLDQTVTWKSGCFSAHEKGNSAGDCKRRLDHRWIGCYASNQAPFMPSMLPLDRKVMYNGSGYNCLLSNCTVALCEICISPLITDVYKEYGLIHYLALKLTQIHRCPPCGVSGQIVDFCSCSQAKYFTTKVVLTAVLIIRYVLL